MTERPPIGTIYASTNKHDVAANHNQRRVLMGYGTKVRYVGFGQPLEEVPVALLTSDGNGGHMITRCSLRPDGVPSGHRLVSDPDPEVERIASVFHGIGDLEANIAEALRWPRAKDGGPHPKVSVRLNQDEMLAVGRRILELAAIIEQNAMVAE